MAKKAGVNLFAAAKEKAEAQPKKPKGTEWELPRVLNEAGELTGESKILNEAVTQAIAAAQDEKAAKNRCDLAKGKIGQFAFEKFTEECAARGVAPPTPLTIVNHRGESVTYVLQNKAGQNKISEEQVEMLTEVLGERVAEMVILQRDVISFDPDVMAQTAKDGELVESVVAELVSKAVMASDKLSDEQKANLIQVKSGTYLSTTAYQRMVELCGSNVGTIRRFLQAAGSAIVKYIRT